MTAPPSCLHTPISYLLNPPLQGPCRLWLQPGSTNTPFRRAPDGLVYTHTTQHEKRTEDSDGGQIASILVSLPQDLQTINSVLRSARSEGAGPKRNLMASLMASPQPLELGTLPAAKRMALSPTGLSLPSTSPEHMSAFISNIQVGSHPLLSPTSNRQLQGPPLATTTTADRGTDLNHN